MRRAGMLTARPTSRRSAPSSTRAAISNAARDRAYRERRKQRDKTREENVASLRRSPPEAGQGHFDPDADVEPIRALLDQGLRSRIRRSAAQVQEPGGV